MSGEDDSLEVVMRDTSQAYDAPAAARTGRTFLALLVLFVVMVLIATGCTDQKPSTQLPVEDQVTEAVIPESYEQLYDSIDAAAKENEETDVVRRGFTEAMREGGMDVKSDMAATQSLEATAASDVSTSSDYSETNAQVEGIDEADIVKTDGTNIYFVSGGDVVIARAAGDATEEIGRITPNTDVFNAKGFSTDDQETYQTITPNELYIHDGTLAVLYQYYFDGTQEDERYYMDYFSKAISEVALYDVSDAQSPRYIKSFGQDGSFSTSRLHEGTLYLVSNFYKYNVADVVREDPVTYVPLMYVDVASETLPVQDICMFPDATTFSFSVVSSIDVSKAERIDKQSVLGASDTVYMSTENLYLGGGSYASSEKNKYQDGSFEITEYIEANRTKLARLALDKGAIELQASGVIPGTLLNQFSLDEYEGHLRAVTTVDSMSYRVLKDDKGTLKDYSSSETSPTTNSLYVLDDQLNTVGSIEGVAKDEQVYSVRFDGPVGYFVTFKQVDPLFAVDLSDPTSPTVKSALKIPGFSTYLHPYGLDRLLGLGRDATAAGRVSDMKLSMFDTVDPYNVTEKHVEKLDASYSSALHDHKAVFVDSDHNIIGFPISQGYLIYGYSDQEGFALRKQFEQPDDDYSSSRGLFIDKYLYLCSAANIGVYTLDTLEDVKQVPIEVKGSGYVDIMPLAVE